MASASELTMIRASKAARKRIDRLAIRLEQIRHGRYSRPAVIDEALDALEKELAQPSPLPHHGKGAN